MEWTFCFYTCRKSILILFLIKVKEKPFLGNKSEVVTILSCMAAGRRMYLVANMGRHVSRGGKALMFNTDLAFDRWDWINLTLILISFFSPVKNGLPRSSLRQEKLIYDREKDF